MRSKIFVMRKLKVTELNRLTPEAFKESKKIPLIVVLDHVRSLNNVGSVFRPFNCIALASWVLFASFIDAGCYNLYL